MKIQVYKVEKLSKNLYFCPTCHRQIILPFKNEVKMESTLNLLCGNCKDGKVKIQILKEVTNGS